MMSTIGQAISVEDLQRSGQGKSRVVTIKPGQEVEAGRIAERSGADVVPFKVGGDQMYLAGRGLKLKGVNEGKPIAYQGRVGAVNGEALDRRNSFTEGFHAPASIVAMTAGIAGGAGVGLVMAGLGSVLGGTGSALLSMFLFPTIVGSAVGFGFAMLGGLSGATKRVNLDAFSRVAK